MWVAGLVHGSASEQDIVAVLAKVTSKFITLLNCLKFELYS